jgi:hypothetical protein
MLCFLMMLLPLMGFVLGCVVFTIVGSIVLAFIPKLHLNLMSLLLFVVGALPGALLSVYLYGRAFADSQNYLTSKSAVLGSFAVMLVGGASAGVVLVLLKTKLLRPKGAKL